MRKMRNRNIRNSAALEAIIGFCAVLMICAALVLLTSCARPLTLAERCGGMTGGQMYLCIVEWQAAQQRQNTLIGAAIPLAIPAAR